MSLISYLERSRAAIPFREALAEFSRSGRPSERITVESRVPAVKAERVLTQLLKTAPELEVERVEVRGSSGCEYFRGELTVHTADGEHQVRFYWDCKWRAQQLGWTDCFGFPDQVRAAREFGYDCFRSWEMTPAPTATGEPMQVVA
jgi:hypothetical protein